MIEREPGSLLLFACVAAGGLLASTVPTGAAGPRLVSRVTNAYPSYSPDGSTIAYMSNADGDFDIYVIDLAGGVRRRLTDSPGLDGTPSWSPDGRRIAFEPTRDGRSQIYVMNADGTGRRTVSNHPAEDGWPVWSPDGSRILFASLRSGSSDLYIVRPDGSGLARITNDPDHDDRQPAWHPDGERIAFARYQWFRGEPFYEASEIYELEIALRK